jgi:hypothetical protein
MEQNSSLTPESNTRLRGRRVLGFLAFGLQIQRLKVQYSEFLIAEGLTESEAAARANFLELQYRINLLVIGVLLVGTGWLLRLAQLTTTTTFLGTTVMYTGILLLLRQVLLNKQSLNIDDITAWLHSFSKRKP